MVESIMIVLGLCHNNIYVLICISKNRDGVGLHRPVYTIYTNDFRSESFNGLDVRNMMAGGDHILYRTDLKISSKTSTQKDRKTRKQRARVRDNNDDTTKI